MTRTVEASKALNHVKETVVVIAGSGICAGGRIKHQLVKNISRSEGTILFVGYRAIGTLSRHIMEDSERVRVLGEIYPLRAKAVQINGKGGNFSESQGCFRMEASNSW